MKVGTAKTIVETEKKLKRKTSFSDGFGGKGGKNKGGGGGGSNGGGGDDGNKPDYYNFEDLSKPESNKARILTVFLLVVVLMTFGGLIATYIVLATNQALEWRPFSLPPQIWISTVLILISSLTYTISNKSLERGEQLAAKKWFMITTAFGAAFISSQILLWLAMVNRGYYLGSNPYAGLFYLLTAVHAVHVLGGICALGAILLRCWNLTSDEKELDYRQNLSNVVGWYWHTMDALWIVLFFLLGFWK